MKSFCASHCADLPGTEAQGPSSQGASPLLFHTPPRLLSDNHVRRPGRLHPTSASVAQGAQYGSPAGSAGRDHTSATSVAKYKREDGIKQGRKNKQNENREEKISEKAKGDKLADSQSFLSPAN